MRKDLVILAAGVFLLPWMAVLWTALPDTYAAQNWRLAWVGFDGLEALGLLTTAWLVRQGDHRASLAAIGTATLLLVDAWFDVATAGDDVVFSLVLALLLEMPLAALCAHTAWRLLPCPVVTARPARIPAHV